MTSSTFFQNVFSLRRSRVAIFAEIIKIVGICLLKESLKTQRKVKRIGNFI